MGVEAWLDDRAPRDEDGAQRCEGASRPSCGRGQPIRHDREEDAARTRKPDNKSGFIGRTRQRHEIHAQQHRPRLDEIKCTRQKKKKKKKTPPKKKKKKKKKK